MNIKVLCFLPSHHEHHVQANEEYVTCQDGSEYQIDDGMFDRDELEVWSKGTTMNKLMVTILVPIEHCSYEYKSYGEIDAEGTVRTSVEELEITEVTVPGMLVDFYDVDSDNVEAEAYLIKILESR